MSFVTKRERVFNEYKLYDLPARNEGKLKAYASCTDARAWSHFIADKTDHLFEIMKRNNEKCRPKYVPTEVIVDTLMMAKNNQISRLKLKVQEFERMLAAYNRLDLNEAQKSEIGKAHTTIKAANKELDDLYIDLDLSGDAEGIDSEAFGTGQSRGDEISRNTVAETTKSSVSEWSYIKEPKPERSRDEQSNNGLTDQDDQNTDQIDELMKQIEHSKNIGDEAKISNNEAKFCDTGTYAEEDARIEKLEDMIVTKDAKLNAMQNMIAVLESDVCEPYCIYAHIYTALEKIFAILRQNLKYKQYLDLLTLGQDIQQVHIKGKILYKIKILEKFCIALIAPCSITNKPQNCTCYRAEVLTGYETTYAVSATESSQNIIEKKRAHLIADIIDIDEIKEAMDDQSLHKSESDTATEFFDIEESNAENKSKFLIKNLQSSYSKLVTCYEILKSEKDLLYVRCQELLKVDEENESLRNSMKDYNNLWNEMEYFRQRSESLDKLKAKYYILLNETTNLESKFVAESEKNKIKSDTINELRDENLLLDKKLTESSLAHEKEINFLIFKMKEIECAKMCKEQQIKSLSNDMEKYFNKNYVENDYLQINEVLDRMAKEKDQIYFEETCNCKNVKIDHLQQEINNNLAYINELKLEVEKWEKKYDDAVYTIGMLNNEIRITNTKNHELSEKNIEKSNAIDNLHNILQNKSEQIEILNEELERQESKNVLISMEINRSQHSFTSQFPLIIENELQIRNNQNTNVYEYKKNESFATKEECVLSHENSYTHSVEIFPDYTENIEQTLLYVPERESVAIEKLRHDLDKYTSDDDMQYKIQNRSQEIDKSERIPSIHKYAKDISIEISKIENDLKERLSLLENEQKKFLEYSAETDTEFMFMTNNTYDSKDNHTSSSTNCNHDDLLSQIKLLRQQSTATIAKCDDIKEQYKKSLSLTKKEISELRNVTLKPNDINNVDDTFNKMIQDTFKENKNLTEQLKQKNNETKELLAEINKMRINFQDKIMTLETEKHKLLNNIKESSNKNAFISRFSENNNLLPNEPQSSDVNNEQKDVQSQFKLLRDESSAKINTYDNVKEIYKKSLEISKNESDDLKSQITHISNTSKRSEELISKYNKLLHEKNILQNELCEKTDELSNVKNNCQQVHCQVKELEPFKQKYELLYTETENKLMDKEAEINKLRKTNNLLENDIKKLTTLTIEDLKGKINYLELLCDGIKVDKEEIKTKLEEEKKYLKDIKQQLESTEKENNDLVSQITNLKIDNNAMKNCISLLENNILIMQSQLDSLNKIITEKDDELLDLKKIYTKFTEVQIYNDVIKKENMKLQQNLKICNEEFRTLEDENKVVNMLNHNILSEMEAIKTELNIKKEEITRTNLSFRDIKEEIEEIKAEKSCDNERELDLLNKLQICEQIINKLKEDLSERNSSISELQNHINNLQEEIKNLHENLETAIDNSEKGTQEDIEEIDESVKKVKAHYTKATHNIKPEITKLQDINERLNLLKLGTKEADIEKEKRISRINCLENERETVIHNLNQLEVAVLGLCNLSNKSCTIDIIDVLHNIQKAYEDKNASNDKTIQNSQISYHLLKTKAEEAQKIAEIERQNIINEKKNNEHNRLNFQAIIQDLNNQLYNKDITHEDIIKDLESKLSNQQNLFDQILDSKENHIENLKNELTKLMEIHEKSLTEVNVLRQKLKVSEDHNNLQSLQINKLYTDYQTRCTEVKMLQKLVQDLNKASSNNIGLQTSFEINKTKQNIKTNDSMTNTDDLISLSNMDKNELMIYKKGKGSFISEASSVKKKEIAEKIFVEPSVDIVKSRLEKLETKLLEQYSICTLMCDTDLNDPDLQNFNTNNPLKYRDSVNIISSTKANDLICHICDDKKTQTVNNKEVKEITNPELENKFSLGNISLPHKQSAKNNLNHYLRKQEIEFLLKKKKPKPSLVLKI